MFSVKQFDKVGGELYIKLGICTLTNQSREMIGKCILSYDLYRLGVTTKPNQSIATIPTITRGNKVDLWHQRLGHISQKRLKQIQLMSKMH